MHEDVIVIVWPGEGVVLLADSVQDGTGGGADAFQSTLVDATLLGPVALRAITEYVRVPTVADDVEHCEAEQVRPVHAYDVGLPVHEAISTIAVLMAGVVLVESIEQLGTGSGGPPPVLLFHSTSTPARAPVPAVLAAETA